MLFILVVQGPEILSKYIGASEQAVRDLFVRLVYNYIYIHTIITYMVSYLVVCNCVVCVYLGGGWGVEGDFWFSFFSILCG